MPSHPLLRNRPFRLLFLGRSLSLIGDAVIPAALSLAVIRATGSASALALVLGCAMGPRLLLLPIGGVVGDRFNARTVALGTDVVRCLTQLFVGVELLGGNPQLWHIALASAVGGAASAFAMPTLPTLITGTVDGKERHAANSALGVVKSTAMVGGPALAGLLIKYAGPGWAFVLDGVSFAVSACLLAAIRVRRVTPEGRRSLRKDLVEGWQEVRCRDWYWTSLVAHSAWNGAAAVLTTLGPAIAVKELGGEDVWIGILQAGAIGLLLGSLLAGRARPRRPILAANLGLATYALPLGLLAAEAPAPLIIGAYAVAQAGLGFLSPVWATSVQAAIPPGVLARVTSYDWLLSLAAMPLGYVLAPLAADAWGVAAPLWIAALVVGVACVGTAAVPGVREFGAGGASTPREVGGENGWFTPDGESDTGRSKNASRDTVS
ncbi:MFS transporter [Streptomyces sp. NBC_01381]|uniref:MFS transporter n=1 Tax=Streptomyces sp. NBC_01381 TaxID=2903845 RepID=UPI00225B8CAA|nr:MFS transporter [Streptomyces sp. NBC_01381]MCX4669418.1 MFS transporter [Streptomyces sp. NBC_01381]